MNYNYLRYFSVLAQVEHYTLAAARLGISQPSLSSAIHHLETELGGIRLFEKVGRNIQLTEEGRYYREKVDTALNELDEASMTLRDSMVSAPVLIRIGVVSGTLNPLITGQFADYIKQNERIRFRVTEGSAEELMDLVRQEKLDMAIVDTTDRDRSLHFRKLCQRNFAVAMPATHPLAENKAIQPNQLSSDPQIVFNSGLQSGFDMWAHASGADEHIICTVNTAQTALDLVAAGVGVCFIAQECAVPREGVRYVPVNNWHQALYMCILYDKWLEPPVWQFVEQLVQVVRKGSAD